MELYFGLGSAPIADELSVTWADGTVSKLGSISADRLIHVTPAGVE
jgi:hypothetical protein